MSTVADLPAGWTRVRESTRWRWGLGTGIEAEATFWGPGSTYADFLKAVGGLEETFTYPGSGDSVTRIVPLKFPSASPDFDDVYAVDCEIEGSGLPIEDGTEGIVYTWARARVLFRSQPFYALGEDYPLITYNFTGGADYVTRPGTAYRFPSDDLRLSQDAGVLVPFRDFSITFHNMREPDEALYDTLVGRVNSADFTLPNEQTYTAGYIHYLGPSGQYSRTIGNVESWTVTHRFKWRYIKHNEVMRPDGTAFEAPVDGNDDPIIPAADLMQLYES